MHTDIDLLLDVGIALSKEKDADRLLETILDAAMDITDCDGGTLYTLQKNRLWFRLMKTKSKGFRQGFGGEIIKLPPVPLSGSNDCARAALGRRAINVADVYTDTANDYSGTMKYDEMNDYRTVSMLSVPMENDNGIVIGVLQLINARDADAGNGIDIPGIGHVTPFSAQNERIVSSLASQAAICLTNRNHAREVTELMDSFVRVMSAAIDERSPYNANHGRNMARYAERFLAWLNETGAEAFDDERTRQLLMSIWLHDIGKLVVPLEIMDKESRLGTRIDAIFSRYTMFGLQNRIDRLEGSINEETYREREREIKEAGELVAAANVAGFLPDEMAGRIRELGEKTAPGPHGDEPYLAPAELVCLTVRKGTLTDGERETMESHVPIAARMLSQVAFPEHFRDVADWAVSHHEYINGTGYPTGLSGDDIPTEVRILTILDIYDALTASDRPYKPAMPTGKAHAILREMGRNGQLDTRLVELFIASGAGE